MDEREFNLLLDRLQRPSIYLRRSQQSPPGKSYFGGFPTLPEELTWPRHLETDEPLHFLLQFECSKLPRIPMRELLPSKGLLFFFALVDDLIWEEPAAGKRQAPTAVLFWPDEGVSGERMPPAGMMPLYNEDAYYYFAPSEWKGDWRFGGEPGKIAFPMTRLDLVEGVSFLPAPETPHWLYMKCREMLDQRLEETLKTKGGAVWDHDRIPQHQVLGAPWLLQSAALDHADKVLLLQIFSDRALEVLWGDVGIVQYWVAKPDLRAGRFDRVFATMECD